MKNTKKQYNSTKTAVPILGRFLAAFGLGMLPIIVGLKSEWYVIPLVVLNFVIQFGLAAFQVFLRHKRKLAT